MSALQDGTWLGMTWYGTDSVNDGSRSWFMETLHFHLHRRLVHVVTC